MEVFCHDTKVINGAFISCIDSFVLMLRYCVNLKEIRYESTSLNKIVADKSHRVIVVECNLIFRKSIQLQYFFFD